jgi:copper oxidase (laccase) domain-containing protein
VDSSAAVWGRREALPLPTAKRCVWGRCTAPVWSGASTRENFRHRRGKEHGPGLVLTVRTADCIPVLLASPPRASRLHAGWRGLIAGILEAGVATFAEPGRLHVLFGPAIGPCCYEVGPEVACQFPAAALPVAPGAGARLDLARSATLRLTALGIAADRVHAAPFCTRCHQHILHSSRGSGAAPGRILAFASA